MWHVGASLGQQTRSATDALPTAEIRDEPTVVVVEPTRTLVLPAQLSPAAGAGARPSLRATVPAGLARPLLKAWGWLTAADLTAG